MVGRLRRLLHWRHRRFLGGGGCRRGGEGLAEQRMGLLIRGVLLQSDGAVLDGLRAPAIGYEKLCHVEA